jgi:M6 family metalloprotease-like protein
MAAKERAIRRPKPSFGRRRSILPPSLLSAFALVLLAGAVQAQQPAQRPAPWLGSAAPPAAILGLTDARPLVPLEFSRAWLEKMEGVRSQRDQLAAEGALDGVTPEQLAKLGAALSGTLRIPVIPVRYADVRAPFDVSELERRLFGAGSGDTVSYAGYWSEVSGGLLNVEGTVLPWITSRRPARHYLPPDHYGWSSFGRVNDLREEVLRAADRLIDFAQFDNDGPDGIPNSGDDDGYVDFVAILYALPCPVTDRAGAIWPHRGAVEPFETRSIGANGEPIRISDYVILPAVDPATCGPLHIGVLAHETGHALGLPDLYDYDGTSQGIGAWGLMGTGSHRASHSPTHLSAWEKEQLGWVTVSWLKPADSAIAIAPVQSSRTVYRMQGEGSEYLLLENRQRMGSDRYVPGSGLLVWSVDPERGELGAWNNDERRPAVGLIEADGRNDLASGRNADSGDPFPGSTKNTTFRSFASGGLKLSGIRVEGGMVHAHMLAGSAYPALIPDPAVLRLTALAGGTAVRQTVDIRRSAAAVEHVWEPVTRSDWLDLQRVGETLVVTADPAGLLPGTYTDTVNLAGPDGRALAHLLISFYLAPAGIGQIVATELPWSWGVAVRGGRILQASYGWDHLGLRPRPRVLQQWEGTAHPRTLARLAADALYAPIIDPRDGASFVLARARDGNYLYQIRGNGDAHIIAAGIGTEPAYGAAILPDGSIAVAQWNGEISHVRRDGSVHAWMDLGTNVYQIASDAEGSIYAATFSGDVLRVSAAGSQRMLETGFGAGRLVAVATTPAGDVFAAERGGSGRVLRIRPDGTRDVVYHRPGAQFYGLAVDDEFLFALDLTHRDLLRIPLPGAGAPLVAQTGSDTAQRGQSRNAAPTSQQ